MAQFVSCTLSLNAMESNYIQNIDAIRKKEYPLLESECCRGPW